MREDERMEIRQLYEAGVSISELARRFSHDRKTIRSALNSSLEKKQGARASHGERKRGSKLEPYKDYVKQRMQLGVLNAERILREIREQGYRRYHRPPRVHEATSPGGLCQGHGTL